MRYKDRYTGVSVWSMPSIDLSIIAAMFILIVSAWGIAKMERSFIKIDKIVPIFTISNELSVMPIVEPKTKKDAVKVGDFLSLGKVSAKPLEKAVAASSANDLTLKKLVLSEKIPTSLPLRAPKIIYQSIPDYPVRAIEDAQQGLAVVKAYILKNGRVGNAVIEQSSGHDILDKAAISAVSQWVFEPASFGKDSTESYFKVPIKFQLKA